MPQCRVLLDQSGAGAVTFHILLHDFVFVVSQPYSAIDGFNSYKLFIVACSIERTFLSLTQATGEVKTRLD